MISNRTKLIRKMQQSGSKDITAIMVSREGEAKGEAAMKRCKHCQMEIYHWYDRQGYLRCQSPEPAATLRRKTMANEIICPNPKCKCVNSVGEGRTEIMCGSCGVTIDLHGAS